MEVAPMMRTRLYGDILTNYINAGSSSCSPKLLCDLAKSEVDKIRLRVAENPRTPISVLELLAKDTNADVRIAVGTNPSTPLTLSYVLACDADPNVRLGLADDVATRLELLERLAEDANPYVSQRAKQTKEIVLSKNSAPKKEGFSLGRLLRWTRKNGVKRELSYA
jgi:hypothetical protein